MVNTFCASYNDCSDMPEVQALVLKFEQFLGENCAVLDSIDEDRIILALRGLKTIGSLVRGQETVEKCFTDPSNSMFIRLAALDTIRSLNCQKSSYDFKRQLFATFSDNAKDSELRIGSYLALMNCPSAPMVNLVKNILVTEPVNQGKYRLRQ